MKPTMTTQTAIEFVVQPYSIAEAFDDFYESMVGVWSPNTITWYKRRLPSLERFLRCHGIVDVNDVTLKDLRKWRSKLASRTSRYENHPYRKHPEEGGLSRNTLHTYVRACRRFFAWLLADGKIQENPAKRLELPPLPSRVLKGIQKVDREAILEAAQDRPRDYAIVMFLSDTAARVGGVSRLTINDLDLDGRRATVREKGRGGNAKERNVFFSPATQSALREWLAVRPAVPGVDYVFTGYSRKLGWGRLKEGGIYLVLKRAARKASISGGFNPHNWRHGELRTLLSSGMSLAEVSQIAGHSSVRVTGDIYGTFSDDQLQSRYDAITWKAQEG